MKLPLILPPEMDFCKQAQSENELFSLIADNLSKALEFLSYALDDEDWCDQHPEFLERVIRWLTELYYKDLLGISAIERIRDIIHQNPQNIKKQLLRDITLQVDGKKHKVNSLLLAAVSPYFNRLLRQDEVKKKKTLHLSLESPEVSEVLIDIAEKGNVDLWRLNESELYALLKQSTKWEIEEAQKQAEKLLTRYVESDQAIPKLKEALKNGWFQISQKACDVFNDQPVGLKLSLGPENRLVGEFLDFKRLTTLSALEKLKEEVTILKFSNELPADPDSELAIRGVQRLWGLDLTETQAPLEQYSLVPASLQYLNLDRAGWLTDEWADKLFGRFKAISILSLADQSRLSLLGLGAIALLENLISLNLSGQKGLKDEQFSMLTIQELPLESLNLSGCQALTPTAIQQFLGNAPRLRRLVLDNTSTDDRCLSEISVRLNQLESLSVRNAPVSQKGILSLMRQKPNLDILS